MNQFHLNNDRVTVDAITTGMIQATKTFLGNYREKLFFIETMKHESAGMIQAAKTFLGIALVDLVELVGSVDLVEITFLYICIFGIARGLYIGLFSDGIEKSEV